MMEELEKTPLTSKINITKVGRTSKEVQDLLTIHKLRMVFHGLDLSKFQECKKK